MNKHHSKVKTSKVWLATIAGFGAILLWSTTVAVTRGLSENVGPLTAAAGVYSVSGVVSLVSFLRSSRKRRRILQLPANYLVGCGILFVGYTVMLFLAIGWVAGRKQVLEVGLINYLWPPLTLLMSLWILGRRANWVLFPGTLMALAGVFLVVTQEESVSWQSFSENIASNPAAYSMALIAAILWALYSNLTRRWVGGREQGAMILFLPVTAMVFIVVCCFVDEPREWSDDSPLEALYLGVATYIGYALWDHAMRKGNVVMVAAASYLTPFFSTIVCCLYLDVVPGPKLWVGCGILILGSILSWLSVSNDLPGEL
ncbi:MAG: aromatic amino acid DMT transporter YddG [Planctomycetes bacterium]|nr:aromatic amino acid DMT transporter YddG [Planctomycetota bacterium]